jgi:hypothetical protein
VLNPVDRTADQRASVAFAVVIATDRRRPLVSSSERARRQDDVVGPRVDERPVTVVAEGVKQQA